MDNAIFTLSNCANTNIMLLTCSAGPETQAMTHTDGGVKCAVQVSSVTNNYILTNNLI